MASVSVLRILTAGRRTRGQRQLLLTSALGPVTRRPFWPATTVGDHSSGRGRLRLGLQT